MSPTTAAEQDSETAIRLPCGVVTTKSSNSYRLSREYISEVSGVRKIRN
jgi:hypothetical protein